MTFLPSASAAPPVGQAAHVARRLLVGGSGLDSAPWPPPAPLCALHVGPPLRPPLPAVPPAPALPMRRGSLACLTDATGPQGATMHSRNSSSGFLAAAADPASSSQLSEEGRAGACCGANTADGPSADRDAAGSNAADILCSYAPAAGRDGTTRWLAVRKTPFP